MKQIDHNPNEPPRQTRGELMFVSIGAATVLVGLAVALKWVAMSEGVAFFLVVCATLLIVLFGLAFRLEARERRNRAKQRQRLGLRSDQ